MGNIHHVTVDYRSPEDVEMSVDDTDDVPFIGEIIDAINDGLITEIGTHEVKITNDNDRYTFEVISK